MFQVIYEYLEPWPDTGSMRIEPPQMTVDIPISPDSVRRRANGYLTTYVSITLHATNPTLVLNDQGQVWHMSMDMRLPDFGYISTLNFIDVDAQTRNILPLTEEQIRQIQDKANAIIARLTPATMPTS